MRTTDPKEIREDATWKPGNGVTQGNVQEGEMHGDEALQSRQVMQCGWSTVSQDSDRVKGLLAQSAALVRIRYHQQEVTTRSEQRSHTCQHSLQAASGCLACGTGRDWEAEHQAVASSR